MKRIISAVLIIATALCLINCGGATQAETKEASIEKVNKQNVVKMKELFDIGDDYENFYYDTSNEEGVTTDQYRWENTSEPYKYEAVYAMGEIPVQYYSDGEAVEGVSKKLYTESEVTKKAEEYLKKLVTDKVTYKLSDIDLETNNKHYNVGFKRYVNDIPVMGDDITMRFDSTLKLVNFDRPRTSVTNKDDAFKDCKMSRDEAIKAFKENRPLAKGYYSVSDLEKEEFKEVVSIVKPDLYLNGETGEFFEKTYNYYKSEGAMDNAKSAEAGLTKTELAAIKKVDGLKSFEEGKEKAEKLFGFKPENISNENLNSQRFDQYVLSFDYKIGDNYPSAAFDGKNLDLVQYGNFINSDKKGTLDPKEALEIGKKFVTEKAPEIGEEVNYDGYVRSDEYQSALTFVRIAAGKPVFNESVTLSINNATKNVESFYKNFSTAKAPSTDIEADMEKIEKEVYSEDNFKKVFLYQEGKIICAYTFVDGKPLYNADGTKYFEEFKKDFAYDNLDNSKYKDEIKILRDYGIGITNKDLKAEVTQKDLADLLNSSPIPLEDYKWVFGNLGLDVKNPDKKVRTDEGMKAILHSYNVSVPKNLNTEIYNKDLFKNVSSINKDDLPYVYYAYGLGMFKDKDRNFGDNLTVEETLHYFYNMIVNFERDY